MLSDTEIIKNEVDQSREQLGKKIIELEEQVKEGVQDTSEILSDAFSAIKQTAHSLLPSHQVRKYPLAAVSLAAVAGFLIVRSTRKGGSSVKMALAGRVGLGFWQKFSSSFAPEIRLVKAAVLQMAVKKIAEKAVEVSPKLAKHVSEMEQSILNRVGNTNQFNSGGQDESPRKQ